jgi:hypothetical protein
MSLSHRKQLTAEQYEAMIAIRTDDLVKAEAETQSLQRRIEELEKALADVMRYDHAPRLEYKGVRIDCSCAAHERARALLSPKEQP